MGCCQKKIRNLKNNEGDKIKLFRVGIAGYGVVGKRRKKCIDNHPETKLIALCDRTFTKDEINHEGLFIYSDYKKLLKHDLDILVICLTNDIAPKVAIAALNKGINVFCEKPPGRTVADILKVIKVEKKYPNLKLMYGFNHRYHDSVKDALNLIHGGQLGKIINLKGVYGKSQLITFNQSDWRTKREISGGGILLDQGIHLVDLMRLFAGDFINVHSFVSNNHWKYNVEDNVYAIMSTKKGVVGMLNSSATQWRHRFNLDINLEHGSIILGGILTSSKSYGEETLTIINSDPVNDKGNPKEHIVSYAVDPSWDEEIKSFINCIKYNKPIENGSSFEALQTMKQVFRIYYADPKWRKKYSIKNPD